MDDTKGITCDWCSQEAPVQRIEEELWRFWQIISAEGPAAASLRNVCAVCKSSLEGFSLRVERCKSNEATIDTLPSSSCGRIKDEYPVDVEYHPLIEQPPAAARRSFECTTCRKVFSTVGVLNRHVRAHSGDRRFACPYCGKGFVQSSDLARHVKGHARARAGDAPRGCPYCDKTFPKAAALRGHLRVHTGDRPFGCPSCGRAFTDPRNLKRHSRVHSGERPFGCPYCGKAFAQSSTLKGHVRVHTGEKPFRCARCGKAFSWSCSLRRHRGDPGNPACGEGKL